jgi:hypothetical protein
MEALKIFLGILSGFKKSIVITITLALGMFLLVKGFINGEQFVDLLKDSLIAYISLSGVETVSATAAKWVATRATKEIDGIDDSLQGDTDK